MLVSCSATLHSAFLPASGVYIVLRSDPGRAAGFSLRRSCVTRRANSEFPAFIRRPGDVTDPHTEGTEVLQRDSLGFNENWKIWKLYSNFKWNHLLIVCHSVTWINLIYLIKVYSDKHLHSARPHTLCNRHYMYISRLLINIITG